MIDEEVMSDAIELVGGDARRDVATYLLQGTRGKLSSGPHPFDGVGILHLWSAVR